MKRILVAIDALNFKGSLVDFACYMARLTDSRLTGMFFHFQLGEEKMERLKANVLAGEPAVQVSENEWSEEYPNTISLFRQFCSARGVNCDLYIDGEVPIEDIIDETRYADLVIADPAISFTNRTEIIPTVFLRELLARAECPVLVAPGKF